MLNACLCAVRNLQILKGVMNMELSVEVLWGRELHSRRVEISTRLIPGASVFDSHKPAG